MEELAKLVPLSELIRAGYARPLLQVGYTVEKLLANGATPTELIHAGAPMEELAKLVPLPELIRAGYARWLLRIGYTIQDLLASGATPMQLLKTGVPANQVNQAINSA